MEKRELFIDGMSCNHCVMAVKKELSNLPLMVEEVEVGNAKVKFGEGEVSNDELEKAVTEAGFKLKEIK